MKTSIQPEWSAKEAFMYIHKSYTIYFFINNVKCKQLPPNCPNCKQFLNNTPGENI